MQRFPLAVLEQSPLQNELDQAFKQRQYIMFKGAVGSGRTLAIASQFQQRPTSILWVLENPEQAAYYLNDLEVLLGKQTFFFFQPATAKPTSLKPPITQMFSYVLKYYES